MQHKNSSPRAATRAWLTLTTIGAVFAAAQNSIQPVCTGGELTTQKTARLFSYSGVTYGYESTSGCIEPNPPAGFNPVQSLAINTDYFVLVNTSLTNSDKPPSYVAPYFTLTGGQTVFAHNNNYFTGIFVQGFDTTGASLVSLASYPPFTMTVRDCYFGSTTNYVPNGLNSNGGVALTGALPPNSVVTFSNNSFIGAIGFGNNNNYNSKWLNTWPGVTSVLASNILCSLCLVDFALLGASAKITVTNNSFLFWFNSDFTQSGYIYSNRLLLQGSNVTISDNAFRSFQDKNTARPYAQGYPCTQVLLPSVSFLTAAATSALDSPRSAASINIMRNDIRISVNTGNGMIGYYNYGWQSNILSTSPATIRVNYTLADGRPAPAPQGYLFTGGNVSVHENFVTGLWQVGNNNNNNNNISCNAAFNFSVLQHPDTAYSLPVVLRVADNQVYGQPQFPFVFSLSTSERTPGNVVDVRGNYYQGASPSGAQYTVNGGYVASYTVNRQAYCNFATVRFLTFSLRNDATVAISNNAYDVTSQLGRFMTNSTLQLPAWSGGVLPLFMGPDASFLLSNNFAGGYSFDNTTSPSLAVSRLSAQPQTAYQFAPPGGYYPALWEQNTTNAVAANCFTCGNCRGTVALSNTPSDWCTKSQRWVSIRYNTTRSLTSTAGAPSAEFPSGNPLQAIDWQVNMMCLPRLSQLP